MPRPSSATANRTCEPAPSTRTRDAAAVGRVLDRVVDEVDQHAADLVRVAGDERHVGRRVDEQPVRPVEVHLLRGHHLVDERQRIAVLDRDVQRVGVEAARPEDVVDGAREPVGLARDDVEQPQPLLVVERHVASAKRHRGAVDRRQRRAQLVRDGRDELGAHALERPLLGQVAERVDDAVRHRDAVDREPELAAAEVERQRLGARRGTACARDLDPRRDRRPARDRLDGEAVDDVRRRRGPSRSRRRGSTCGSTPARSTKKTPSPTDASTRAACARSAAAP